MQRVGNLIKKFSRDYGLETGLPLTSVKNQWKRLVGHTVAVHASPDIIKGRTMFINVDTPQWMHHISFYKHEICEKLKPYNIEEIKFRLGRVQVDAAIQQTAGSTPLSEEDSEYIENTVKNLRDDELRERFRGLLKKLLTHKGR